MIAGVIEGVREEWFGFLLCLPIRKYSLSTRRSWEIPKSSCLDAFLSLVGVVMVVNEPFLPAPGTDSGQGLVTTLVELLLLLEARC